MNIQKENPEIMGILNITPNSFSDGGEYFDSKAACKKAMQMMKEGADIIDVGAESTAPQSKPIPAKEEWSRLKDIIPLLTQKNIPFSVDSYKAEIWEKVLAINPSCMLNDVSGLKKERREKVALLKKYPKSRVIIMFSRNTELAEPDDIMKEVVSFFGSTLQYLEGMGIERRRIIIDPGMGGFVSKDPAISFEIIARIKLLNRFACPILIGTSRKNFLQTACPNSAPKERIIPSIITAVEAIKNGAKIIRAHDIAETREALNTYIKIYENK